MIEKYRAAATIESEPNGELVVLPVCDDFGERKVIYDFYIPQELPAYNFMPRGREVIQRLVMKATKISS